MTVVRFFKYLSLSSITRTLFFPPFEIVAVHMVAENSLKRNFLAVLEHDPGRGKKLIRSRITGERVRVYCFNRSAIEEGLGLIDEDVEYKDFVTIWKIKW